MYLSSPGLWQSLAGDPLLEGPLTPVNNYLALSMEALESIDPDNMLFIRPDVQWSVL